MALASHKATVANTRLGCSQGRSHNRVRNLTRLSYIVGHVNKTILYIDSIFRVRSAANTPSTPVTPDAPARRRQLQCAGRHSTAGGDPRATPSREHTGEGNGQQCGGACRSRRGAGGRRGARLGSFKLLRQRRRPNDRCVWRQSAHVAPPTVFACLT